MNPDFARLLEADEGNRRDLFAAAAVRLGTPVQNVEKDFWVCWTLDALFNGLDAGGPRLLFKGGTSLSKGFGLIARFSEDIDITVFRDDLGTAASVEDLEAMNGKQRGRQLDAIRTACQAFIAGPMSAQLQSLARGLPDTASALRIAPDPDDPDGQSLLLWYPAITATDAGYIRPAVKIEAGAKSALDPHAPVAVKPYVSDDLTGFDLTVAGVTTVDPVRTFWDKVAILHGLRRWFERRGELRGGGQRVSRHYYDIDRLLTANAGRRALVDLAMASDCVRHARMFFNRPDLDLATAQPGSFALLPHDAMLDDLRRDYAAMQVMIFGEVPSFDAVIASVARLEILVNGGRKRESRHPRLRHTQRPWLPALPAGGDRNPVPEPVSGDVRGAGGSFDMMPLFPLSLSFCVRYTSMFWRRRKLTTRPEALEPRMLTGEIPSRIETALMPFVSFVAPMARWVSGA